MSTLSRQCAKNFLKTLDDYEELKELVERAVDPVKPSMVKSHAKNRDKLDQSYLDLCHDWKTYKRDLNLSDADFNLEEENVPKYEYNDKWMKKEKLAYFDLVERSDDKLEDSAKGDGLDR